MARLPDRDTMMLWSELCWHRDRLVETGSKTGPVCAEHAPSKAGLYRVTWTGNWPSLPETYRAQATRRISDPTVALTDLRPPVRLSIGRTTDIRKRIRQHFGSNENNNRMLQRLRQICPSKCDEEIRKIAIENLSIEWVELPDWIERCLLESYGKANERPIFDLDAEH